MSVRTESTAQGDAEKARLKLLDVVAKCRQDRFAHFPGAAREGVLRDGHRDIVLMGGQKSSLAYHLGLIDAMIGENPGLRLRTLIDEAPEDPALRLSIAGRDIEVLAPGQFFDRATEFSDALVVDRYCTWIPGVKYRVRLKRAGLTFMRLEQFLNAPGLQGSARHYREHSDYMLERFDEFLALETAWDDDRSRVVYYTALAATISLDFTWFAFGCDDHEDRYLPRDVGIVLGDNETFVDCGAHDGSESMLFAERVNNCFRSVRAFEPDRQNFQVTSRNLARYMAAHGLANMFTYPMGVYDRNDYLGFTGTDVMVSVNDTPQASGPGLFVTRLDDMLDEMTYLKLEIEGAELAALHGAAGLIRRHRPVLAVATYHKPTDFPDLIRHIQSLDLGYRLALRHHSLEPGVLCIYAVPDRFRTEAPPFRSS